MRLLKGRSFPGKVLIARITYLIDYPILLSPDIRSPTDNNCGPSNYMDDSVEKETHTRSQTNTDSDYSKLKTSTSTNESATKKVQKSTMGAGVTDSARIPKFTKELSAPSVILVGNQQDMEAKILLRGSSYYILAVLAVL
ncbi:hypothetical protein AgCh_036835 [Apium graveolens]